LTHINALTRAPEQNVGMVDHDVDRIARVMIRQYGARTVEIMEMRSRNCYRHADPTRGAFWRRVAQQVRGLGSNARPMPEQASAPRHMETPRRG
jgi:hypothetical protein